ncbi:MAG: YncE family protein [Bacteroidales bacterium]|nr:YncE family protein [Bacteroidales bacterium]
MQNSGVFIVNEGNFTYGNASLSFYDYESAEIHNDIFYLTNGIPLGDVAHSMNVRDSLGYVVINNSGKIYVFNIHTFAYDGKITGFVSPRYLHFLNDSKAYVTDLYAKSVSILNPSEYTIDGSIDVSNNETNYYQHPTEQMVQYDKFVFTNSWSFDNKVLVINSETDELVDSISVVKQPVSMVIDRFNKIWVLCDGGIEGHPFGRETPGIVKINAATREIEKLIRFKDDDHPGDLKINGTGDTLYYINRHVYQLPVHADEAPKIFIESPHPENYSGGFYSLGVDPYNSHLFVADAIDHVQRGLVYRYHPSGTPVDTFKVGINPGDFCFKKLNN